jgi:hypothetical protein
VATPLGVGRGPKHIKIVRSYFDSRKFIGFFVRQKRMSPVIEAFRHPSCSFEVNTNGVSPKKPQKLIASFHIICALLRHHNDYYCVFDLV